MTCDTGVCGGGGWSGPLPGDPDNNSVLSATPAFGGIDVSWSYPVLNPAAVAHTILYRALTSNFNMALERCVVAGNTYYDKTTIDLAVEYFYWIKIVSVNGTVGELIGPASATAKPTIDQTLELLSGKIGASSLAQSLSTKIGGIDTLGTRLDGETAYRLASSNALAAALTAVQNGTTQAMTFLAQETTARTQGDSALVDSFTLMNAAVGQNTASILQESTVRASKTGALEALYTAKLSVNGLVGGFGISNNGTSVDAGFDVDTFWVGKTGANKVKPFIIQNGVTYIDQAVIKTITFDKLRAADDSVIIANGLLKAAAIDTRGLSIKDASGNVILAAGTALDYTNVGGTKPPSNATVNQSDSTTNTAIASAATNANWSNIVGQANAPASNATVGATTTEATKLAGIAAGATVGATFGTNISGQITAATASTFIANAAIQTAQIANLAVGAAQIADAAITSAKIGTLQVLSANIADLTVGTNKITGDSVTTVDIFPTVGGNGVYFTVVGTCKVLIIATCSYDGNGYGGIQVLNSGGSFVMGSTYGPYSASQQVSIAASLPAGTYRIPYGQFSSVSSAYVLKVMK